MKILTFVRPLLVITFAIALNGQAQDYPARIIKIIVPYPAGGGTDVVARVVAVDIADDVNVCCNPSACPISCTTVRTNVSL